MVIIDLFYALFIFLTATGLGRKIFRWLKYNFTDFTEESLFSLGLGLFIFSYSTLGLGSLGLLYTGIFYLIFLVLTIWLFPEIKQTFKELKLLITNWEYRDINFQQKVLFLILLSVILTNLLFNYAPPTGEDDLLLYLAYPKRYVQQHKIVVNPDYDHTQYYFQTIQMLYIIGMSLKGVLVSKLINYFLGISIACGVYFLTKRFVGKEFALLSTVIYYTMPLTIGLSGIARVNFGQGFYTLLAIWAFLNWIDLNYDQKYLYLSGMMSGIAFATKYQGLSSIVAVFTLILYYQFFIRRLTISSALRELSVFLLVSFSICIPWLTKNYIGTGNPFYPVKIIEGLPFDKMTMLNIQQDTLSFLSLLKNILLIPRNLPYGNLIMGSGPMFLAFIPLLLFIPNVKREVKILFYVSILTILFTGIFIPFAFKLWMYFLPSYVFFSIVTAYGIIRTNKLLDKKKRTFIYAMVIFALLFPNCALSYYFGLKRLPLFLGIKSSEEYIREEYPGISYNLVKYCNKNLPEDKTILTITDYIVFSYYYKNENISATLEQQVLENTEEILKLFKDKNIGYIIFYKQQYRECPDGSFVNTKRPFIKLNWFKNRNLNRHLQLIYSEKEKVYLYKVNLNN